MLSPNVNEIGENIAGAYTQLLAVTGFANSSILTRVSPLHPDPEWLTPLRARMDALRETGQTWQNDRPGIEVAYLIPFVNYATTIEAIADQVHKGGLSRDDLMALLGAMKTELTDNRTKVKAANKAFASHLSNIKIVEGQLDRSLKTAWGELADEEQQMIEIAEQITFLQDRVASLQDNLTGAEISAGKSYFQTAATISYTLVTAAEVEIPYLSILSEIYTIGKMAYDLIVTDKQIDEAINKLVKLRVEATEAAQAAAMSKGVIQMISNFDKRMAGLSAHLPALDQMWEVEAGKVQAVIDAINSGADPDTLLDIVSLPSAAASWGTLSELSRKCMNYPVQTGTPVTLSTDKSLNKAIA